MKKFLAALALGFAARLAHGQIIDFAYHISNSANHLDGKPVAAGGVGPYVGTPVLGDIIYFNGTAWVSLAIGSATQVLTVSGGIPAWAAAAGGAPTTATYITQTANASLSAEQAIGALSTGILFGTTTTGVISSLGTTLTVPNGGTGVATATAHGVLLGEGAAAVGVTAAGTTGQVLTGVTGADPTWQAAAAGFDPTTKYLFYEDFGGNSSSGTSAAAMNAGWLVTNSVTGVAVGSPGVANHPGILQQGTGVTIAGVCALSRATTNNSILLTGNGLVYQDTFLIPTLSDATNRFEIVKGLGLGVTTNAEDSGNGLFFTYVDNANSGKLLFHACKASACATLDTTVTVAANTWYTVKIVENSSSSYQVLVNATDAGAFTTVANIPIVPLDPESRIFSVVNAGVNSTVRTDYIYVTQTLSR